MSSYYDNAVKWLKKIADTKYGSKNKMWREIGAKQATFYKTLSGKCIPQAKEFLEWLEREGVQLIFPEERDGLAKNVHFVNPKMVNVEGIEGPVDEDYLAVPLASMPVAAGPGIIPEEKIQSWVLVWRSHESVRHRSNLVAVEIGKDQRSMEPTLHPGDIVLIDRNDFIPKSPPGNIYLVRFPGGDGEAGLSIKRVQLYSKNKQDLISFYSDNPQYPPDIYDLNVEYDGDIKRAIVGRVVWAWSDMSKK